MKPRVADYLKVIEEEQELYELLYPFVEIIADAAGSSVKGYAMIKGHNIGELYDIVKANPDTYYRFCGSDYILDSTREEFDNVMFSAIIRKSRVDSDFAISELVGSRICELFSVACPFVAPMGKSNKIVASVDFLKYSQEMETFAEYTGAMYGRKATATDWARRLKQSLDRDNVHNLTDDKKKILIKDLIKHYLVRRFLLHDNDFNCENLAIVSGSDMDLSLISFDFEFCLNNYIMFNYSQDLPRDFLEINIKGLTECFPDELSIAIDEMKLTPEKFSSVEKIFSRFLNPSMAQFWSYSLARNMEAIEFFQKQYCQEKDVVYEQ